MFIELKTTWTAARQEDQDTTIINSKKKTKNIKKWERSYTAAR